MSVFINKGVRHKVEIQKSTVFLYTSNKSSEIEFVFQEKDCDFDIRTLAERKKTSVVKILSGVKGLVWGLTPGLLWLLLQASWPSSVPGPGSPFCLFPEEALGGAQQRGHGLGRVVVNNGAVSIAHCKPPSFRSLSSGT